MTLSQLRTPMAYTPSHMLNVRNVIHLHKGELLGTDARNSQYSKLLYIHVPILARMREYACMPSRTLPQRRGKRFRRSLRSRTHLCPALLCSGHSCACSWEISDSTRPSVECIVTCTLASVECIVTCTLASVECIVTCTLALGSDLPY